MLDTVVFVDADVIDYFSNEMILAKINAEVDSTLAREHHISGYPTAVMLRADGSEIDRIVGYMPADAYLKTIKEYEQGIGTLDDLLSRVDDEGDRAMYYEIADKYKYRGGSEEAIDWYGKVIEVGEPTDSLSGEARMAIADMHRRAKEYDEALTIFANVKEDFGTGRFAEAADIWTAIVYRIQGDTTAAIAAFEAFAEEFPESGDIDYVNAQIEKLKNPPKEDEGK